jgi:hypothetical protein
MISWLYYYFEYLLLSASLKMPHLSNFVKDQFCEKNDSRKNFWEAWTDYISISLHL